jgi:hypothetical protein
LVEVSGATIPADQRYKLERSSQRHYLEFILTSVAWTCIFVTVPTTRWHVENVVLKWEGRLDMLFERIIPLGMLS